ncbi:WD repeat-containing protein 20 isoform X4 [Tympanuchus pallidicinctus]|uniref:WD repeat-containing protein 20 isoform X4 n=1 Tax=Tympanuchus pallidicinctus TaxID=109042 RepID=UPI002286F3B3|nr:WD repeat-containing protein 20 isoform X4 [Tympanuchus pallidicinctus]
MLLSKMAAEGGGKEMNEIKTQFTTREGLYKLLSHSEYSRPNRVPFNSQGSNPVRVSFVNVNDQSGNGDRLCFNVGRELYFYIYKGVRKGRGRLPSCGRRAAVFAVILGLSYGFEVRTGFEVVPKWERCGELSFKRQAADLSKPIDKRIYKGTQPTCHDFNHLTATAESVSLLVGFSAGQVQLIDPIKKETSKLFNEEGLLSSQNQANSPSGTVV